MKRPSQSFRKIVFLLFSVSLLWLVAPQILLAEHWNNFIIQFPSVSRQSKLLPPPPLPTGPQACRYNGECPIGMFCGLPGTAQQASSVFSNPSDPPGTCQPFPLDEQSSAPAGCLQACQAELAMDEHFYHNTFPIVLKNYATLADTHSPGCALDFYRQAEPEHDPRWKDLHAKDGTAGPGKPDPSIVTWEKTRFRHVVRTDPILSTNQVNSENNQLRAAAVASKSKQQKWRTYCTAPCQTDDDCQPTQSTTSSSTSTLPFVCRKGACKRSSAFWEPNKRDAQHPPLVLVTGATLDYWDGLANFVASAQYWAPTHRVVIYHLGGMGDEQFREMESWPNVHAVEWKHGPPSSLPEHVRSDSYKYAWKPWILHTALQQYKMILWLDAGSTLTGPLSPVETILKHDGAFLVKGQDLDMTPHALPDTYKWFGFDKDTMLTGPSFSGNTQGYLAPSRYARSIVWKQASCALDEACIAPLGHNLANHRYDQTALSICGYQPTVMAPHHTEFLAAEERHLKQNLQNPSHRIVWTSRQSCGFYRALMRKHNYTLSYWDLLAAKQQQNRR